MRSKRPREFKQESQDKHVLNDDIKVPEVMLIGADGEKLGVFQTAAALERAEEDSMDLVLVAPGAKPPVCKIIDYGKLKYREQKKAAEARKRTSTQTIKEIRLRYATEQHDLETKVRNARRFILAGDRVRFQLRFRGREVVYQNLGVETLKKVAAMLEDIAVVEEFTERVLNQRMFLTVIPKVSKSP